MRDTTAFEARLAEAFDRYAAAAPVAIDARALARSLAAGGRAGTVRTRRAGARPSMLLAAALLAILAAIAGVIAGAWLLSQERTLPGRFLTVEPMRTQRYWAAGAVLPDGRVFIVGGRTQDIEPADAELFDPTSGRFERTRLTMSSGRISPTATTLADGRILVAGGSESQLYGSPAALSSADMFDPATGTFAPTGSMTHPRAGHTATLLTDGRILVVGGISYVDGAPLVLSSAEVYDPRTGAWTDVAPLPERRVGHAAVALRDGRVLVAGGSRSGSPESPGQWGSIPLATALVFDPSTRSFAEVGSLAEGRRDATATLLRDGRVLVAGGNAATPDDPTEDVALAGAEIFDPATGRFSPTGPLITERFRHAATLLPSGDVLITGGNNVHGHPFDAELFDPGAGHFRPAATAAAGHQTLAALLPDGRVLLADGEQNELFDPAGSTPLVAILPALDPAVTVTGSPVTDRAEHTATKLQDGRVLLVGGQAMEDRQILASAEIYDPRTGEFAPTGSLAEPRSGHAAVLLDNGRVLIAGGSTTGFAPRTTIELFDPSTGTFTAQDLLNVQTDPSSIRSHTRLVRLADGRAVVFGPMIVPPPPADTPVTQMDPFTVVTELDSAGAPVRQSELVDCAPADAVAVGDGGVFVLCWSRPSVGSRISPRMYDPATGTSTAVGSIELHGWPSPVVALPDGRILMVRAGGRTGLALFDPRTGASQETGSVVQSSQAFWVPAALADGRVILVGESAAWAWDPGTGTTKRVAELDTRRVDPTLTVLDDGRVLVVGGAEWPADRTVPRPPGAVLLDPASPR